MFIDCLCLVEVRSIVFAEGLSGDPLLSRLRRDGHFRMSGTYHGCVQHFIGARFSAPSNYHSP